MKTRILAFFFLGLLLIKAGVVPFIYLDFELRREYIVKYLCVNRDKPKLNCNGKCYLSKRIAEARESEQQNAERNFVFQLYEMLAEPVSAGHEVPIAPAFYLLQSDQSPYSSTLKGRLLTSGVFQPPIV